VVETEIYMGSCSIEVLAESPLPFIADNSTAFPNDYVICGGNRLPAIG
jgi:hypothetical protein